MTDIPDFIKEALDRANVYAYTDWVRGVFVLTSVNLDAPLTDEEKTWIINHLRNKPHAFPVIFR